VIMNSRMRFLLASVLLAAATAVFAAESGPRLEPAPVTGAADIQASLQRGARNFANYCLNCHSAQYMRYNRLRDIGLSEQQIADNLMFATDKVGNTMTVAMSKADAQNWFGAAPPDLTVEARVRGRDWLYSYLLGFYRDEKTATGWNNLVFPNVAMPHVLWSLGGTQKLVETTFEDREQAEAAMVSTRGLVEMERQGEHKYVVKSLALDIPGSLSNADYRIFVDDTVNYMDYMAEPVKMHRINLGIMVLLYLAVLFVFAYVLKRSYWKDIH